jgi:nucleoside phosphorylase
LRYVETYNHVGSPTCEIYNNDRVVKRTPRDSQRIVVHRGTIASSNHVMRDGVTRDKVSSELGGVLCFEMEAAALMNSFSVPRACTL